MARTPLPDVLGAVFSVAEAQEAGVSASRLRARDLQRPYRGLRVVRESRESSDDRGESLAEEHRRSALLYAHSMPVNQFFSHVTAAVLWGLPVPISALRDEFGRPRGLDVGVFAPLRHPRHHGVLGHQVRPEHALVVTHEELDLQLTSPASTWALLGAVIRDEYDLVALGDAVVRERMFASDPPSLGTIDQLHAVLATGRRVGAPRLRDALSSVRTRSASRMETRSRLIIVDAGLPEPDLNHIIRAPDGEFVACVDLAYPRARVALEYEGEHHLTDPRQWATDIARYEALAGLGWFVLRITKHDVFDGRSALVRRVRTALVARSR